MSRRKPRFPDVLRELRATHGLTMRAHAMAADMDPGYLSRLENGKTGVPKAETVRKLARALCQLRSLPPEECDRLERRLLVAAGHLQEKEDLIEDLSNRFAARLRDAGVETDLVDELLGRVPLGVMRSVLVDGESLDLDSLLASLADARDGRRQRRSARGSGKPANESASAYLDRHARDFTTTRRSRRASASPSSPSHDFPAGPRARILIHQDLSPAQFDQLRTIAALVQQVLETPSSKP